MMNPPWQRQDLLDYAGGAPGHYGLLGLDYQRLNDAWYRQSLGWEPAPILPPPADADRGPGARSRLPGLPFREPSSDFDPGSFAHLGRPTLSPEAVDVNGDGNVNWWEPPVAMVRNAASVGPFPADLLLGLAADHHNGRRSHALGLWGGDGGPPHERASHDREHDRARAERAQARTRPPPRGR